MIPGRPATPRNRTLARARAAAGIVAVLVMGPTLASCGSGDDDGSAVAATGTSEPSATTTATASGSTATTAPAGSAAGVTTTATATASTAADAPTTSTTAGAQVPVSLPDESNCAPGAGALPDGLWFGYRTEALDDILLFDLACWFSGEPAVEAAAADNAESPPPNDYYIRNTADTVRDLPVASPDIPVLWLPDGSTESETITYNEWVSARAEGYIPPIWVTVQGGTVVSVVEQYLP